VKQFNCGPYLLWKISAYIDACIKGCVCNSRETCGAAIAITFEAVDVRGQIIRRLSTREHRNIVSCSHESEHDGATNELRTAQHEHSHATFLCVWKAWINTGHD
jgi:hypothetical protein